MALHDGSRETFLQDARLLLGNCSSVPALAQPLEGFGYTASRWVEGRALFDAAEALVLAQARAYGEQYAATAATLAARSVANRAYSQTLKIARMVLTDPGSVVALGLAGPRCRDLAGWVDQATSFYANLEAASIAALGRFGYTPAKLANEAALVEVVVARVRAQARRTGEARQATADRDAALARLDAWLGSLRTVLRVALADDPQTLEAVGITVARRPRDGKKGIF